MARTFAIFAKPDTVLRMIPRRVRIGSCAWFVRTGSMKHVVRRMASLKIERFSLAVNVLMSSQMSPTSHRGL